MSTPSSATSRGQLGSNAIIGALFFIFGFVTWLNAPLIAFAELAFDVSDSRAFLIPFAFYISYFCLVLPSSAILRRTGMKKGMALGPFAMAMGAAAFGQFTTGRVFAGAVAEVGRGRRRGQPLLNRRPLP
jgi:fucose permease